MHVEGPPVIEVYLHHGERTDAHPCRADASNTAWDWILLPHISELYKVHETGIHRNTQVLCFVTGGTHPFGTRGETPRYTIGSNTARYRSALVAGQYVSSLPTKPTLLKR